MQKYPGGSDPNNHQSTQQFGLDLEGGVCPSFGRQNLWLKRSWRLEMWFLLHPCSSALTIEIASILYEIDTVSPGGTGSYVVCSTVPNAVFDSTYPTCKFLHPSHGAACMRISSLCSANNGSYGCAWMPVFETSTMPERSSSRYGSRDTNDPIYEERGGSARDMILHVCQISRVCFRRSES